MFCSIWSFGFGYQEKYFKKTKHINVYDTFYGFSGNVSADGRTEDDYVLWYASSAICGYDFVIHIDISKGIAPGS